MRISPRQSFSGEISTSYLGSSLKQGLFTRISNYPYSYDTFSAGFRTYRPNYDPKGSPGRGSFTTPFHGKFYYRCGVRYFREDLGVDISPGPRYDNTGSHLVLVGGKVDKQRILCRHQRIIKVNTVNSASVGVGNKGNETNAICGVQA